MSSSFSRTKTKSSLVSGSAGPPPSAPSLRQNALSPQVRPLQERPCHCFSSRDPLSIASMPWPRATTRSPGACPPMASCAWCNHVPLMLLLPPLMPLFLPPSTLPLTLPQYVASHLLRTSQTPSTTPRLPPSISSFTTFGTTRPSIATSDPACPTQTTCPASLSFLHRQIRRQ